MKRSPMVNWTIESKYDIPNVKLDLRLGYFGVNAFIEARFYFTLGFSRGGVLFFGRHRLPVRTVCGAHVIL